MAISRVFARPMLASTFVYGGVQALRNAPDLARAAKPVNDGIRVFASKVAPSKGWHADLASALRDSLGPEV